MTQVKHLRFNGDRLFSETGGLDEAREVKVRIKLLSAKAFISQVIPQELDEYKSSATYCSLESRALGPNILGVFILSAKRKGSDIEL